MSLTRPERERAEMSVTGQVARARVSSYVYWGGMSVCVWVCFLGFLAAGGWGKGGVIVYANVRLYFVIREINPRRYSNLLVVALIITAIIVRYYELDSYFSSSRFHFLADSFRRKAIRPALFIVKQIAPSFYFSAKHGSVEIPMARFHLTTKQKTKKLKSKKRE